MNENSREILVRKYFLNKPPSPDYSHQILYTLGGLILLAMGIKDTWTVGWLFNSVSLVIIVVQTIIMVNKYNVYMKADEETHGKATDQQMDDWLKEDKQMMLTESMQALDMEYNDTSAFPLMIEGRAKGAYMAVGADKVLRFSAYDIVIFYLTEHHVAAFQCHLDMAKGSIVEQKTQEFPYKDITNLETATTNSYVEYTSNKKTAIIGKQEFGLHTSGGNHIRINYSFNKFTDKNNDFILPPSEGETTIKAVRKKLKEYKDRYIPELNMSM